MIVYEYWVIKNQHISITFGFSAELLNAAGVYHTTLKTGDISSSCSSILFGLQSYSANSSQSQWSLNNLQGFSFAWALFKVLGETLGVYSHDHMYLYNVQK